MNTIIAILIWLTIVIASVAGYVLNVVALLNHVGFGVLEVVRIIGLFFPPLGVIMGYI